MAGFLSEALLLLISIAVIMVVHRGQGDQSPDSQPMMQPISHSSGLSVKHQQSTDLKNPSAMLTDYLSPLARGHKEDLKNLAMGNTSITAPTGNNTDGTYLQWESKDGHAFCQGGFSYSRGNLVVPRKGLYRVFLQITYESIEGFDCNKLINIVYVFRDDYPDNVCLLSSVDRVNCSKARASKSLYTAGLFFLEANCKLRVTSSHPELIVKKQYQVFFGAEFLSQ